MTKKHAYMIIAHNEFEILRKLVTLLDDERNDIYLHIDLKEKSFDFEKFESIPAKSNIYFVPRIKVNWGGYSLIQCELNLLRQAVEGNYTYYHLISGVDLPLKTQDEIHEYFYHHEGTEFIHFATDDIDSVLFRVNRYHLDEYKGISSNRTVKRMVGLADKCFSIVQQILKVDRLKEVDFSLKFGANWFSITHDCAEFVLENERWIDKYFSRAKCADELYLQTLIYNSEFRSKLSEDPPHASYMTCLRNVDWKRGTPYLWRIGDFEDLISSGYLFARKFNMDVDQEIVNKICSYINGKADDLTQK
jgi:hypothetical protein